MVSKVEGSRVRKQGKDQKQEVMRLHKVCKFKRSSFSEEQDATCSAMLLLACVVCNPSSIKADAFPIALFCLVNLCDFHQQFEIMIMIIFFSSSN